MTSQPGSRTTSGPSSVPGRNDALSVQVPDPTQLLLGRLDGWKHTVGLLQSFVEVHISTQKDVSAGLEKARKSIADAPRFDYSGEFI